MAINYYGSCSGTSATKYDLWINIAQNSQSVDDNQSNVTVKFYVKRNDGYSASAYNLNEEENSVKLTVNGNVLVSENIEIDTRNNVSFLLASWTGNLTHNADGKLSVPVKAEFTMGNSSLSSGSVSATLTCTTIQRKSSLSFSSSTINPGVSVIATVTAPNSNFRHSIMWSLGGKSSSVSLEAGVLTAEITVPADWLSEIPDVQKAKVTVTITAYNGSTKIGVNTYTLSLVVPATDAYKPSFSIGLTRHDNGVPSGWGVYVQGISKVSVSPEDLVFKYGATLDRLTITVGSVSIRSLPATFNLTEAGDLTVTVAVRDTRGLLTVKTTMLTVYPYSPPSVQVTSLERCNSNGELNSSGEYLCAKYTLSYSSVASKNVGKITAKYKTSADASYSSEKVLSTNPAVFGDGKISVSNSVDICFTVTDSIITSGVSIIRSVPSGAIPFNIRRGGTGAAFGRFSEKDNELSVGWDLCVDGNVNIGGELNSDKVSITCSDNATDLTGEVMYYPFVKGCFVRIRVKANKVLSAGTTYILAHIPDKPPGMFTPLDSLANYDSGGMSTAGVVYKTGDVAFRSDTDIAEGTYIYISGFYIADYA